MSMEEKNMNNELNIKEKTINLLNEAEQQVQEQFKHQEEICCTCSDRYCRHQCRRKYDA